MYEVFLKWFEPYYRFLRGGAYSLEQSFDGLHWMSTNFLVRDASGKIINSYWSPDEALAIPFALLLVSVVLLVPVLLAAFYTLHKIKGVAFGFIILIAPGVLNYFGLFPDINYIPRRYVLDGTGTLGQATGFIPVLILAMLWGWALVILIYDNFNLGERFRQLYDHLWFPTALAAAVFFVADSDSSTTLESVKEHGEVVRSQAGFLLSQVERYDAYCQSRGTPEKVSCKWASNIYHDLYDLKYTSPELFKTFGPQSSTDMYSLRGMNLSAQDVIALRKEIYDYNQEVCPIKSLGQGVRQLAKESAVCQTTPSQFCTAFPDDNEGAFEKSSPLDTVALSTECVIPTLVQARKSVEKMLAESESIKENKHYRLFYFVIIAFVLGGKVANSSTKLTGHDRLDIQNRRRVAKLFCSFLRWITHALRGLLRRLANLLKWTVRLFSERRKARANNVEEGEGAPHRE